MSDQQNSVGQLVQLLETTLRPDTVKKAQEELQRLAAVPGFARALLQVMCDSNNLPVHIRNAASVALKNFVRTNWSGEGEAPLADDEREELRNALLDVLFQVPSFMRSQMTEIVCQISKVDFPERWPRLIQVLAQHLQGASDFDQLVVSLGTLEQLVNRYRFEMRSNRLWTEIILVVNNIAEPLTQLYSRMLQYLPDPANASTQLAYNDRMSWLQIILELTRIYHSLISQDLPEYFEDNLTPWMEGFIQLLDLKLDELEAKSIDSEPNEHDRLRGEICEIATLFSQRFEECFLPYTERFIGVIWNLLVMTNDRIRFDTMVSAALGFLAAICQRPQYAPHFRNEGVLKAICENVVVKNLMLRKEDLEIYECEPFEFLKRDIEGSDLETRRRGAADFVRALCRQFEPEVCALLSSGIQGFLADYRQNPVQNFVKKDVVYFLVSALASRTTTARHGATDTNQLINVADFYQEHVRMDLLSGSANDLPILRSDALKYLVLFRNQLSADQIVECFRGENGQFDRSIVRLLSSSHLLLHHYMGYALERLLLLKAPNTQNYLLTPENIPLGAIIDALFACFQYPQAYETHYIMKALMRSFTLMNDEMARQAHIYVGKLSQMVAESIRVPKNPLLVHFVFESLCVLTRKAYARVEGGLDRHMIPIIELIIENDVADYTPYSLQIIALLLDQNRVERERGVEVAQDAYIRFFPSLLRPDYWSRSANIPALMLVFESFIRCFPQLVFGAQYSDQVMGILQRLIASKAYDQHGFRLANALLPHLESANLYNAETKLNNQAILTAMLTRMQTNKTSKYSRQFTIFMCRYAAIRGGATLASALEAIQSGLYGVIWEKIMLVEMRSMPQTTTYDEKRVVTIGAARLITETIGLLGQNYAPVVETVVNILEAFEHKTHPPTDAQEQQQEEQPSGAAEPANELEYSDPYCKLSYAQHPEPFVPEVVNIKKHFAQAVLVTAQRSNPETLECLNARVQNCLRAYFASSP